MGEPLLIAVVLLVGLGAGAFLQRAIPAFSHLLSQPNGKTSGPATISLQSTEAITRWLIDGRAKAVLDSETLQLAVADQQALYEWLRGAPATSIHYGQQVSPGERSRLSKWFWAILLYLATIGVISASWAALEVARTSPRRMPLAVVAGILGSCIAAFRSCLDRRAAGFEDQYGNVAPGFEKKERFSDGMVVWFLGRPVLGAAVGLVIYAGLQGGVFSAAVKEGVLAGDPWKFFFYTTLAGLFAKTILDILLDVVKKTFKV
jgi:hypothetical protein